MSASLLRRVRSGAYAWYRGIPFYTSDAFSLVAQLAPWVVKSDAYGDLSTRQGGNTLKTTFTPLVLTDASIAVMYPFAQYRTGQFNTPVVTVASINTGTSVITTKVNHLQLTGTGVRFASTGTMPTGVSATTTYYLNVTGATTLKLYDTYAHAIAGAGTGLIAITGAGSGTIKMIQNTPLIINCFEGTRISLWNTAVTKMPGLNLSSMKAPLGSIEFESYILHGQSSTDDDSRFTIDETADEQDVLDRTQIPSVPYTAAFGNSAPFTDLQPRDGVAVDFAVETDEVKSDAEGLLCRSIKNVTATAKIRPVNLTVADLLGEMALQGMGAGLGVELPSAQLNVYGPGNAPYLRLNGATMQDSPTKFGASEDQIDTLTFKTTRTFTDGVADPVFSLGMEAPE